LSKWLSSTAHYPSLYIMLGLWLSHTPVSMVMIQLGL